MSVDTNWPRWIYASVSKHFVEGMEADSLTVFLEGTERNMEALGQEFMEYRQDGPMFRPLDKIAGGNYRYKAWIDVNIIFRVNINDGSFHRIHEVTGLVAKRFVDCISIYKYGSGVDDTGEFLTHFQLDYENRNPIDINHFGQVDKDLSIMQGSVSGQYIGYLTTSN